MDEVFRCDTCQLGQVFNEIIIYLAKNWTTIVRKLIQKTEVALLQDNIFSQDIFF